MVRTPIRSLWPTKQKMISASVLAYSDYEKLFILYTNTSYEGLGFIWVLCNRKGGNYLKKSNLYLYAKNALNIIICPEIVLT